MKPRPPAAVGGTLGSPHVTVLLASFNGCRWIGEQIDSILSQRNVDVSLVVSDDGSADGTVAYVRERAAQDARVTLLEPRLGPPGVTGNFLHLFRTCVVQPGEFVALSDQDDLWLEDKLALQVALMTTSRADAVSSNVVSFDATGRRHLIMKNDPQQKWDHLFEAAGPGSTYLFSADMHSKLCRALSTVDTSAVGVHDWLLYALVRALGGKWVIDGTPTVEYRQHEGNVQGEHVGLAAFRSRLAKLRSGFYRKQFLTVARIVLQVGTPLHGREWNEELERVISSLEETTFRSRLSIWRHRREIRRNRLEGFELALACVLGVW